MVVDELCAASAPFAAFSIAFPRSSIRFVDAGVGAATVAIGVGVDDSTVGAVVTACAVGAAAGFVAHEFPFQHFEGPQSQLGVITCAQFWLPTAEQRSAHESGKSFQVPDAAVHAANCGLVTADGVGVGCDDVQPNSENAKAANAKNTNAFPFQKSNYNNLLREVGLWRKEIYSVCSGS